MSEVMRKQGRCPKNGEFDPPKKDHHAEHFGEALQNALDQWDKNTDPSMIQVTFTAHVSENPGGIKEYFATITPAG